MWEAVTCFPALYPSRLNVHITIKSTLHLLNKKKENKPLQEHVITSAQF